MTRIDETVRHAVNGLADRFSSPADPPASLGHQALAAVSRKRRRALVGIPAAVVAVGAVVAAVAVAIPDDPFPELGQPLAAAPDTPVTERRSATSSPPTTPAAPAVTTSSTRQPAPTARRRGSRSPPRRISATCCWAGSAILRRWREVHVHHRGHLHRPHRLRGGTGVYPTASWSPDAAGSPSPTWPARTWKNGTSTRCACST